MASKKATSKSFVASDAYTRPITRSRSKGITQDKSKKEAHHDVMSVMMADITAKAAMEEMERKVNFLIKVVEERDHEITALREQMRTRETADSSQTPIVKATNKGKNMVQENQPQQQLASIASLSVQQLQDMIANSIRAQYEGPP
ncbi:ty3-gypsy retrotransposon protein [Cucumis melo var. makuwa]|uniref:Ty3-gypsy retrotransposon protein n=1 Tax=Cucumis melo var. makuwa TaxID=1194695 RepID=A0A5A7SK73_CUCMM|nr:ty3-gypsy retrotransposon protein [Cucumis melo var. makuwa]TYJ96307.1 ty3-gypsy retrotransposon protein [Cucumis melo var. makuwa]